jgi:hypothetical protein
MYSTQQNMIKIPETDNDIQFLIANKGTKNLLVVGLNPPESDCVDSGSRLHYIQVVTKDMGYDGWVLVNLFPNREARVFNMDPMQLEALIRYNIHLIKVVLDSEQFEIKDVLFAWGNGIESESQPYLKQAAGYLYKELLGLDLNYLCFPRTRMGNPRDLIPENWKGIGLPREMGFRKFDFQDYIRRREMKPQIEVEGLLIY